MPRVLYLASIVGCSAGIAFVVYRLTTRKVTMNITLTHFIMRYIRDEKEIINIINHFLSFDISSLEHCIAIIFFVFIVINSNHILEYYFLQKNIA